MSAIIAQNFPADIKMVEINTVEKAKKFQYSIVSIKQNDKEPVLRFLRQYFFQDEPLNVAVNLLDTPDARCYELEQFCTDLILEGASIMAVSQTGEILGVCLNSISRRPTAFDKDENEEECPNPKFRKIVHLLTSVTKQADIYGRFPVESVLNIEIVSVSDTVRGQGIAKVLILKSRDMASEMGIPLIEVLCTSYFSAKAAKRIGFECVYELAYRDHLDANGQPVFVPDYPHNVVRVFVMSTSTFFRSRSLTQ